MNLSSSNFSQTVLSFHVEDTHALPLGVLVFRISGCQSVVKKSRTPHSTENRKENEQEDISTATHAVTKHCLQMAKERENK